MAEAAVGGCGWTAEGRREATAEEVVEERVLRCLFRNVDDVMPITDMES